MPQNLSLATAERDSDHQSIMTTLVLLSVGDVNHSQHDLNRLALAADG